ncbi:hypothetical protein ACS0TY_015552 [Phlomoides rotata]
MCSHIREPQFVKHGTVQVWAGFVKLNVDVYFFADSNQMGVRILLWGALGNFIMGRTLIFHGCVDVKVGEAMGFFEALSWANNLNLEKVVVEGDTEKSL